MSIPSPIISFETILPLVVSGDITAKEILSIPLGTVSLPERQALLITMAAVAYGSSNGAGGTWGSSNTIPTPRPVVFRTVTGGVGGTTFTIPASIHWRAEVLVGNGVTSGSNTIDLYEAAFVDSRVDGQAHPALALLIPENVVVRVNYLPIA